MHNGVMRKLLQGLAISFPRSHAYRSILYPVCQRTTRAGAAIEKWPSTTTSFSTDTGYRARKIGIFLYHLLFENK